MAMFGKGGKFPVFGKDPATVVQQETVSPTSQSMLGHTAQAPAAETMPIPRAGVIPLGASGRANFWGLPQPDEINRELVGIEGIRRFNEMYRTDPHVRRLVLAAWSPLVAGTWTMDPYGEDDADDQDRQIAETIWWLLNDWMSPNLTGHLYELGPVLLRSGFTPHEQLWDTVKDPKTGKTLLSVRKLDLRLPISVWRWWQDDFAELTHIGQILPNRADVVIPATQLNYYRLGPEGDNWQGTSILRHAYKPWVLKDRLERIDAIGQERKAVGVPVVYPPKSASNETRAQLEQALMSMHMSEVAYLMMPGPKAGSQGPNSVGNDEWLLDVIQFDSSSGDGINASLDRHERSIASSMLQDFLELGHHQVGARATADVQEDPFITTVAAAVMPPVLPVLNRMVDRIRRVNWPDADGSPKLKVTLNDEASLSEIGAYVVALVQAGLLQVDPELEDWMRQRAGMPAANAKIREQKLAAQQAGLEASAQQVATTGEQPDAEPPNPDELNPAAPGPAKPSQPAPTPAKPQPSAQPAKPAASKQLDAATTAGGLIVHAADTGRVLMVKRTPDDSDDADVFASWEFPGGKLDGGPGGTPDRSHFAGATREWGEETGATLPAGHERLGDFKRGPYRAFVTRVAHETDLQRGHSDKAEVSDVQWRHPDGLAQDPTVSRRARALLPGLQRVLTKRPVQLDAAPAPLSSGTNSDAGLQMVPEVGPHACTCEHGHFHDGVCQTCGGSRPVALDSPSEQEPTARWFERLLSHDQLKAAFDGARDHIEQACAGPAADMARAMAQQTQAGTLKPEQASASPALLDALTSHYTDLYQLGRQTVQIELAKQRAALGKQLDSPADAAAQGARAGRPRERAEQSARSIANAIAQRLGRDQIAALKDPASLRTTAEQAATAQLHDEALSNTAAVVNEGRADAAEAAADVVGAYYTAVLDPISCDACIAADDGQLLTPEQALSLGPPNPDCAGGDRCRCALVWVLSDDPAALGAVTG